MSCGPEVKMVLTVLYDSDIHRRCARYDIWVIHAVLGLDLKVQTNRCVLKYFCLFHRYGAKADTLPERFLFSFVSIGWR